jgi:23S rRNA (cytosine1962-C5)-methyltransferase
MVKSLRHIPPPGEKRIAMRVTAGAERALRGGHPWVFDQAIQSQSHEGRAGDLAVVFDKGRKFLGIGLYDPHSPIRVRVLAYGKPTPINQETFRGRLEEAARKREDLPGDTTGYRLVHGANDGLPGLVIDRYEATLVVKLYTAAWLPHLNDLLPPLVELVSPERLVLRLSRGVQKQQESLYGLDDGDLLLGDLPDGPLLFKENGLIFEVDPFRGHKTGFYLDQRENRERAGKLSVGMSVLNLFAYTGGFSIYAARGGAREVTSVDTSNPALAAAQRNFAHNQDIPGVETCQHRVIQGDVFDALPRLAAKGLAFDMVIIDPPAFAKREAEINRAIQAYQRLTHLGLKVLKPGGILVQASCSSRVGAKDFFHAVNGAARSTGRPLVEIERTGHPSDHPVGFKEGAYLKCLFARG